MSPLSSLLGQGKPAQPPCLIFRSPDAQGNIKATNPQNQELALFAVSKDSLTRIRPNEQQVCTFKRSSLSGNLTLNINGQQIKVRQSGEVLNGGRVMETPLGKLKWRSGSGGYEELRDGGKVLLARGKLSRTFHPGPSDLEVFVPGDEFLLDLILAAWVGMVNGQEAETKEIETLMEVLSAVAGS